MFILPTQYIKLCICSRNDLEYDFKKCVFFKTRRKPVKLTVIVF